MLRASPTCRLSARSSSRPGLIWSCLLSDIAWNGVILHNDGVAVSTTYISHQLQHKHSVPLEYNMQTAMKPPPLQGLREASYLRVYCLLQVIYIATLNRKVTCETLSSQTLFTYLR